MVAGMRAVVSEQLKNTPNTNLKVSVLPLEQSPK